MPSSIEVHVSQSNGRTQVHCPAGKSCCLNLYLLDNAPRGVCVICHAMPLDAFQSCMTAPESVCAGCVFPSLWLQHD